MKKLKAYIVYDTDLINCFDNNPTLYHIKCSSMTQEMIEKAHLIIYKDKSGYNKILKNILIGIGCN
jgi:hypothetical protein